MKTKNLNQNLEIFLRHIDSIRDTLPMTMLLIQPYNRKANDDFLTFVKEKVKEIEDDNGQKRMLVKADESKTFEMLERNASISSLANKIIHESLFVSLISQYDAFLTRLLRAIYEIKPEVLNGSDRNLTFSQIVELNSIEQARELIIEKEIDTVLRKSHSEQFEYLEKLIGIKLRVNLTIWPTFIEITERRNLLVHCDGVVSNHYIKNCLEHKCDVDTVKVGDRLGTKQDYFLNSYKCLYEIATKLTHTIWRKLMPSDLKNADTSLNEIGYNLINSESFQLADLLLDFGVKQTKHFNDSLKNVFIINCSLSKYLQNKKDEAKLILDKKDWSASSNDFKLAYAVLTDDYEVAYDIMQKIGNNGEINSTAYKEWPLFNIIRKERKFKEVFKSIFEEDYSVMETPMRPLQELITKEMRKDKVLKDKTTKKTQVKDIVPHNSKKKNIEEVKSTVTKKEKSTATKKV